MEVLFGATNVKKLLVLLAALWLVGCAASPKPETFVYACEAVEQLTGNTCDGLVPPIVIEDWIVEDIRRLAKWQNLYGLYYGGDYIYVHPKAPDKPKTIVHETVHYIMRNPSTGKFLDRCKEEELARIVGHAWNKEEYDDGWLDDYRCGTPSQVGIMNLILR